MLGDADPDVIDCLHKTRKTILQLILNLLNVPYTSIVGLVIHGSH